MSTGACKWSDLTPPLGMKWGEGNQRELKRSTYRKSRLCTSILKVLPELMATGLLIGILLRLLFFCCAALGDIYVVHVDDRIISS
jgi:hypothetical protein